MNRFTQRLTRLEKAQRKPVADRAYAIPEPPPGWYEAILRLLWEHGLFSSVENMLLQVLGIDDDESIAAVKELVLAEQERTD